MRPGGTTLVAKRLIDAKILHPDQITVTGRTIGEEAKAAVENRTNRCSGHCPHRLSRQAA